MYKYKPLCWITFCLLINTVHTIVIDTFTVSPDIFNSNSNCISIISSGTVCVTQSFNTYTRTSCFTLENTENIPAYGNELCITDGYLRKSSGPVGKSYFNMEYNYFSGSYLEHNYDDFILFRMNADLVDKSTFTISFTSENDTTFTQHVNLSSFLYPETEGAVAIYFPDELGSMKVKQIALNLLPPMGSIDFRMSNPNIRRQNFFEYRAVNTVPHVRNSINVVDGNVNTYLDVENKQEQNVTVSFPATLFKKTFTLTWNVPPVDVVVGYINTNNTFIKIQQWKNKRLTNTVLRRNLPNTPITNIHLMIRGGGLLSEITRL